MAKWWKRCVNLRDLAHYADPTYQPEKMMTEKQALDVSRGNVGDMMALDLLYLDASTFSGEKLKEESGNLSGEKRDQNVQKLSTSTEPEPIKYQDEFCKDDKEDAGLASFFEDGKHVRNEFRLPHKQDGCTEFSKEGKLVRRENKSPHEKDGLTDFYENGRPVRQEYRSPHEFDTTEATVIDASRIAAPPSRLDAATLEKRIQRRQKPAKVNSPPPRETVQSNAAVSSKCSNHSEPLNWVDPIMHNKCKAESTAAIRCEERLHSRKCPTCMRWNLRIDNNNHIKCACGIEFCFLCTQELDGHFEYGTKARNFGHGKCKQHGDPIMRPSPSLLNKLGHVTRQTESVAAFSINTLDAALPPSNKHAKERSYERCVSDEIKQRTLLRGSEEATSSKDGTPSTLYRHGKHKLWTSEDGAVIKSVA